MDITYVKARIYTVKGMELLDNTYSKSSSLRYNSNIQGNHFKSFKKKKIFLKLDMYLLRFSINT